MIKIVDQIITNSNKPQLITFKGKNGYIISMRFIKSPFHNCQMGTLGNVNMLLIAEEPIKILSEIFEKTHVKLLLVDIQEGYVLRFKKIFKKGIISTKRYKSSNKSKMCIIIIQNKW